MGIAAEMKLNGTLRESCGVFLGPPVGYPRRCLSCGSDPTWTGAVVDAYDKNPRNGGKAIEQIVLSCDPYQEALRDMPVSDLALEGGFWATREEFIEGFGGDPDHVVWVVRFDYPTEPLTLFGEG